MSCYVVSSLNFALRTRLLLRSRELIEMWITMWAWSLMGLEQGYGKFIPGRRQKGMEHDVAMIG
jgi:hypothetical protein